MFRAVLVSCLIFSLISPAFAVEKDVYPYMGVTLGTALTSVSKISDSSGSLDTDFKSGYMAGLIAGIAFNTDPGLNIDRIRVEAEAGYRTNELLKIKNSQGQSASMNGAITVKNFMINGYLDNTLLLTNGVPVKIFVTAGGGIVTATSDTITYQGATLVESANDTQFAYQGGLGFGYEPMDNITLDVTYKYLGTAPFKFGEVTADYGSHNIMFGAWYAFK